MSHDSPPSSPFQFTLTALLALVAVVALLLASREWQISISIPVALVGLAVLLIATHVVGNKLGTHLRDHSPLRINGEQVSPHAVPLRNGPVKVAGKRPEQMQKRSAPCRGVTVAIGFGASAGLSLGGYLLWTWFADSWSGWALGTVSSGVIGGIMGFLLASFLEMSYRAWDEAAHDHDPPRPRSSEVLP